MTQHHAAGTAPLISLEAIQAASIRLKEVAYHTPLMHNLHLSEWYGCNLFLKREDLQVVRSYKVRGAYNKMSSLPPEVLQRGVVCASAGNHAQGVAFACRLLQVKGKIYMPSTTPSQKIQKVKTFGKEYVEIVLTGDTYDAAYEVAMEDCTQQGKSFIHPFNDEEVIAGQATVAVEILQDSKVPLDAIIVPIGGGGLMSGVGSYFRQLSPRTRIIGVQPAGAPSMVEAIRQGKLVTLPKIDRFVDGAAVKRSGDKTFRIVREIVDEILLIEEGKICSTILKLYNEEAIVVEPAGAMSVSALEILREELEGKNVCCIISGGNNDITRTEEIKERSLLSEGLKHYFIIRFPQRAGALREFLNNVLGPDDDITHFEYTKKNNRDAGPALVGIELKKRND
ncbi:MAG: threonine ammonia-lyase IlvA, partial [Saprospiraceae bacterium]|nr:threonine ammonia-lyase IlvA [Saprospiraceae bacterium]